MKEEKETLDDLIEDFDETVKIENSKPKSKKISLDKISIISKNEVEKHKSIRESLYGSDETFEVVLTQSAYKPFMKPLKYNDARTLLNSNLSPFEYRKQVYQMLHSKISDSNIGPISFENWLKVTSIEDLETLYYGIYCITYPNEGSFTYECPVCGETNTHSINNNNLIQIGDIKAIKARMKEISTKVNSLDDMRKYSLVFKEDTDAFSLPKTGMLIKLKHPNLYDTLKILQEIDQAKIQKDSNVITSVLYIETIYVPDKTGSNQYLEVTDLNEIYGILDNLNVDDFVELDNIVAERADSNKISYSIKNVKCSNADCNNDIGDLDLSLENILFTLIYEKIQSF